MLFIGMVIGYLIHPILNNRPPVASPTALAEISSPAVSVASLTPTPDAGQATQAAAIMAAVVARTRHFKGNPEAPVTLIEFGDFQ